MTSKPFLNIETREVVEKHDKHLIVKYTVSEPLNFPEALYEAELLGEKLDKVCWLNGNHSHEGYLLIKENKYKDDPKKKEDVA